MRRPRVMFFFFFNDTATTEIYTLSLHDALPIWPARARGVLLSRHRQGEEPTVLRREPGTRQQPARPRSEEHTSELQSQSNLVCRLLLEKKKKKHTYQHQTGILRNQYIAEQHKRG